MVLKNEKRGKVTIFLDLAKQIESKIVILKQDLSINQKLNVTGLRIY